MGLTMYFVLIKDHNATSILAWFEESADECHVLHYDIFPEVMVVFKE